MFFATPSSLKNSFFSITYISKMDKLLLQTLLSRFDKSAFKSFTKSFFEETGEELEALPNVHDEDVYFHPLIDSYGESLHSVYVFNYQPIEILNKVKELRIEKEKLKAVLDKISKQYRNQTGYWGIVSEVLKKDRKLQSIGFLTNFSGFTEDDYREILFPQYKELITTAKIKPHVLFVGSYDSFIDRDFGKAASLFEKFLSSYTDGLSINLNAEGIKANYFTQEKNLISGVFKEGKHLYEPVYVNTKESSILSEFSSLIERSNREDQLEGFLRNNYREIFGPRYDKIETQIWLKFPEIDIKGSNRRLDVFLRNSIENDWELFEIKKANLKLARTYRDIPVFCNEVFAAKQQLKNYKKILDNDSVKRKFAKSGIEYFEPSLRLVIGRTPSISLKEWRHLIAINNDGVKIITYDELIKEMSIRLKDREAALILKNLIRYFF